MQRKKGKFRKGMVGQVKQEEQEQKEQKKLRERYHVDQEDVLVVEKNNMVKFIARTAGGLVKILAGLAAFLLAVVGLAALVYPESRSALYEQAQQVWRELLLLLPF